MFTSRHFVRGISLKARRITGGLRRRDTIWCKLHGRVPGTMDPGIELSICGGHAVLELKVCCCGRRRGGFESIAMADTCLGECLMPSSDSNRSIKVQSHTDPRYSPQWNWSSENTEFQLLYPFTLLRGDATSATAFRGCRLSCGVSGGGFSGRRKDSSTSKARTSCPKAVLAKITTTSSSMENGAVSR